MLALVKSTHGGGNVALRDIPIPEIGERLLRLFHRSPPVISPRSRASP